MPIKYQGISGQVYLVGDKLAGGGEGSIHTIENVDSQVAKIFRPERRSEEREKKLRCMVQTKLSAEQLENVTWPQDVIYNQDKFVGYIMPKLKNATSLTSIYSDGRNDKYDLRYRVLTAINLCYAVQTVHDMGQVCGDLNPQNICINLDMNDKQHAFHITLVDTDSYHFTSSEKTYRCEVGLADYIAPEVQKRMMSGSTLKTAPLPTYTKETDLFALAVHIFTLLMNGCHPFACAKYANGMMENTMSQMNESFLKDSVAAPQPIENIKNGFFPFYDKREGITYPIYAPPFDSLPVKLQHLFVRTFVEGYTDPSKRVDTQEWIEGLISLGSELIQCNNKSHYFFSHNKECPFCNINQRIVEIMGGGRKTPPMPPEPPERPPIPPKPPEPPYTPPMLAEKIPLKRPVIESLLLVLIVLSCYMMCNQYCTKYMVYVVCVPMAFGAIFLFFKSKIWTGIFCVISGTIIFVQAVAAGTWWYHGYRQQIILVLLVWIGIMMIASRKKIADRWKKTWWLPGLFACLLYFVDAMCRHISSPFVAMLYGPFSSAVYICEIFMLGYWTTHTYKGKK